eukprot:scaffold118647_cov57-Attheya_sp.AAC.1
MDGSTGTVEPSVDEAFKISGAWFSSKGGGASAGGYVHFQYTVCTKLYRQHGWLRAGFPNQAIAWGGHAVVVYVRGH